MDEEKPEDRFDDIQEGKIITPLPPDRIHSTKGIVIPKAPFLVARERQALLGDMPKELQEDDWE